MITSNLTKYDALHPSNHDYAWSITEPVTRPCVVCRRPEEDHQEEQK